jgi:hypothetical protein
MNLGNYPHVNLATARKKFHDAASLVADGTDPQGELIQQTKELTVSDLKTSYIKHCYTYLVDKSVKHQSRTLEKDLLPVWGDRPITSISQGNQRKMVDHTYRAHKIQDPSNNNKPLCNGRLYCFAS